MINYLIYSNVGWPQFEADPTNAEGQKKKKKSKSTKIMVNGNSHKKQMTFTTIVYH